MKKLFIIILATAMLVLSSCGDKEAVSSNPVEDVSSKASLSDFLDVSSSSESSAPELVTEGWWNTDRLNDWGLKKIEKPDVKGSTYMQYEENKIIKLVLECESIEYVEEYAEYLFDYVYKRYDTVYKGPAGTRKGEIDSFDQTKVINFTGYKIFSMIYDYQSVSVWVTVSGDINSDGSVNMVLYISKALG